MRRALRRLIAAALLSPLLGLLFIVAALSGIGGAHRDERTGNVHVWRHGDAGTLIEGANERSGRRWRTFIGAGGARGGIDADGNYWTYDPRSGAYHNRGTGVRCEGFGAERRCAPAGRPDASGEPPVLP